MAPADTGVPDTAPWRARLLRGLSPGQGGHLRCDCPATGASAIDRLCRNLRVLQSSRLSPTQALLHHRPAARDLLETNDLLIGELPSGPHAVAGRPTPRGGFDANAYLDSVPRQLFLRAPELAGGNQSTAVRLLGVTPQAVNRLLAGPENHAQ